MIERNIGQQFFVSHEELCSLTSTNINNIKCFLDIDNMLRIQTMDLNNSNVFIDNEIDVLIEEDNMNNQRIWLRRYSVMANDLIELLDENKPLNYEIIEDYMEEIHI